MSAGKTMMSAFARTSDIRESLLKFLMRSPGAGRFLCFAAITDL
jgi:hypothetical protein